MIIYGIAITMNLHLWTINRISKPTLQYWRIDWTFVNLLSLPFKWLTVFNEHLEALFFRVFKSQIFIRHKVKKCLIFLASITFRFKRHFLHNNSKRWIQNMFPISLGCIKGIQVMIKLFRWNINFPKVLKILAGHSQDLDSHSYVKYLWNKFFSD